MYEIRPQTQTLQVVSRKIRKPFTMVLDCIDDHRLSPGAKNTYRRLTSLIRLCGGVCDWTERRIVAHLGMRLTTYQYHRRALESFGLIEVTRRRKPGCRFNDANLLRLKGGASDFRYLKTTELNTNTTTPREVPRVKSYAQIRWEWNQKRRKTPHVGGCRMRFKDAWQLPSFQPHIINPKPDSELTLAEKVEIDETRKRIGLGPLYGVGGVQ